MKHSDIEKLLAENRKPNSEEQAHLADCESCRSLTTLLNTEVGQPSGNEFRSFVSKLPTPSPVKPLPSNTTLAWMAGSIFLLFSLVAGLIVGLKGFDHLSVLNRILYYSGILICGMLFSVGAVQVAVPGSRVVVPLPVAVGGSCLGIALLVAAMFQNFAVAHFLEDGIPCLLLGSGCAILFGVIASLLLRKAYVTDILATAVFIGTFAGFSGVAVLSLHCPIQNATHIIVWHLGVIAVAAAAGLLLSIVLRKLRIG